MSVRRTKQDRETQLKLPLSYNETHKLYEKYNWVETSIWTEKMLTALETGLKGEKWFSLIDKVYSKANLKASWLKVKQNKGSCGVDKISIERFATQSGKYLQEIHEELKADEYQPNQIKRVWIPKIGKKENRPLGIPTIKDRIVQTALRNVLEPIFEITFYEHSYGFRPKRSCKDALREVDTLLKQGYNYIVEFDIVSYFDNVNHQQLLNFLKQKTADNRIIELITKYLKQETLEECKTWTPEKGTPQGAVISPLLANIYLNKFDKYFANKANVKLIRYADDGIVLCKTKETADQMLEIIKELLKELNLEMHPEKSGIINIDNNEGFGFLGYYFFKDKRSNKITRHLNHKSLSTFRNKIRALTKRQNGASIETVIEDVNKMIKGWFEYFKHCSRFTFTLLDGWIRMRLRRILRMRAGRTGNSIGADHQRYPNSYFTERGFFSLYEAYVRQCQSR